MVNSSKTQVRRSLPDVLMLLVKVCRRVATNVSCELSVFVRWVLCDG